MAVSLFSYNQSINQASLTPGSLSGDSARGAPSTTRITTCCPTQAVRQNKLSSRESCQIRCSSEIHVIRPGRKGTKVKINKF